MLFSTEQVSKYHPDKVCDIISDAILDACLKQDKESHVAVETMFKGKTIVLGGEITTVADVNYEAVANRVALQHGYPCDNVIVLIDKQSPEIANGVRRGKGQGAGDQGMMYGYACNQTESKLPFGFDLANRIIAEIEKTVETDDAHVLTGDAKCQVTVDLDAPPTMESVKTVLVSACTRPGLPKTALYARIGKIFNDVGIQPGCHTIVNPAGIWTLGGPAADCGMTGRKIVCDQYGGYCPVGGGAFSGKDPSKVDRSAAYMARALACRFVDEYELRDCEVQLAYAIGYEEPVSIAVKCTNAKGEADRMLAKTIEEKIRSKYDTTPYGIIKKLNLLKPQYEEVAKGCHYRKDIWRV